MSQQHQKELHMALKATAESDWSMRANAMEGHQEYNKQL